MGLNLGGWEPVILNINLASPFYDPSKYEHPNYRKFIQYAHIDSTPLFFLFSITFIKHVTRKFLLYTHVIDNTMLHVLNNISTATINGTKATLVTITFFLNYKNTNQYTKIIYRAIDMILKTHYDST